MGARNRGRLASALPLVASLALLAVGLTACDGGDDRLGAEEAARVASDAQLRREDLPAADWTLEESKTAEAALLGALGEDGEADALNIRECEDLRRVTGRAQAGAKEPLATGSRLFESEGEQLSTRVVTSSISVFEQAGDAEGATAGVERALEPAALEPCIRAAFAPAEALGLTVSKLQVTRPAHAVGGSHAARAEVEAAAGPFPVRFVLELHAFDRGQTLAVLGFVDLNSDLVSSKASDLVRTFERRVSDAQP